jgi:hypothetical protein
VCARARACVRVCIYLSIMSKVSAATFLNRCVFLCVHTGKHDNTAVRVVSFCVLIRCDFLCFVYTQANTIIRLYGALILSQGWLVWKTRDVPGFNFFQFFFIFLNGSVPGLDQRPVMSLVCFPFFFVCCCCRPFFKILF